MASPIFPIQMPGQGTGNPTLDAIHALPEDSKQALAAAHSHIVGQIQAPQIGGGIPGVQPTPDMNQAATPSLPHIAPPRQQVPTLGPAPMDVSGNQAEFSRLTAPSTPGVHDHNQTGLSGIEQIHNPYARVPLQILDAIGSTFAPRLMSALPGTQFHHNMLVGQQAADINEGENEANDQQKRGLEAAQTEYTNARPEIENLKQENAMGRAQLTDSTNRAKLDQKTHNDSLKAQISSLGKGLTVDDNGNVTVDPTNPITKKTEAQNEYFAAREDLAKAQAELARAHNDPNSPAYQLALRNADLAQRRIQISEGNLGLRGQEVEARLHGTQNGVALPGATETPDGQVVGQMFATNVKPTAGQMTKADLGRSAKLQITTMKDIIGKHPEFFGPGEGRKQAAIAWLGSQDPDVQRFMTAQSFLAEHGSGMFGSRNYNVIKDIKNLGRMNMNADALLSSLDQAEQTTNEFVNTGTRHYSEGGGKPEANHSQSGPKVGTVEGGYRFKGGDPSKPESWEKVQ